MEHKIKNYLYSIIIPVYNGEKTIKKTVSNILSSKMQNFELILVLDGPTNHSAAICQAFLQDDRVKMIEKKNGGIYSAREAGLCAALGEYVLFCDQDDKLEMDTVAKLEKIINRYERPDVLCMNVNRVKANGDVVPYIRVKNKNVRRLNEKEIKDGILYTLLDGLKETRGQHPLIQNFPGAIWHAAYRRNFLTDNNIHFEKCPRWEDDWLFSICCYAYAKNVCLVDLTLYNWYVIETSTSHTVKYTPNYFAESKHMYDIANCVVKSLHLSKTETKLLFRKHRWARIVYQAKNEALPDNKATMKQKVSVLKKVDVLSSILFPIFIVLSCTSEHIIFLFLSCTSERISISYL